MQISIIAAIGKNRELGKDNKLIWHISQDFKRFKELTSNHVVIMGRKTYESLPENFRPLPNRVNIVVTRNKEVEIQTTTINQLIVVNSIEEAINEGKKIDQEEIFIIGGASIYEQGIKYADKLYLTLVDKEYPEADAFFPEYSGFKIVKEENHQDEIYKYRFVELKREKILKIKY